jgi:hypothetical protein
MPLDPCKGKVSGASKEALSEQEAGQLLDRMRRYAEQRAESRSMNYNDALREIAGEMKLDQDTSAQILKRNMLLDMRARREAKSFVSRFPTIGEGLLALLEGSSKLIQGARRSIDYQMKALHGKYIGRLLSELEKDDLLKTFRDGKIAKEIYIETGELRDGGSPGRSGSKEAVKIAKILSDLTNEMVSRQNMAGAYINRLPWYTVKQTHDMDQIRRAGGAGNSDEIRKRSFQEWSNFVLPLLDREKTFRGADPLLFMRNVHESLYTGVHGPDATEADVHVRGLHDDMSRKASSSRVLHFKDAESAFNYNERFGIRDLKDQVFSDIFYRSRSIAMMENLGPSAGQNWDKLVRELQEEARIGPKAAEHADSLHTWKIDAAFDVVSGRVDIPKNYTLSKAANILRSIQVLSKMGGTLINALSDKVFMNQEAAYQGIGRIERWGAQLTGMFPRSEDQKQFLRLAGVAMEGIIGNTISRYTAHSSVSGTLHKLQQKLFDVNFMNWWTDTNKATMAELMSAHLGEHSTLTHDELPDELRNVLSLYNISRSQWDAIRSTAWIPEGSDVKRISPDQVSRIPDPIIDTLLQERELKPTNTNRQRVRNELELSLRTYFSDRIDYAIPTPGATEKRIATLGTRPGTPAGEAVRMVMMFKAFPTTILTKIMGREIYGRGSETFGQWALNDHKGKFNTMQLVAMTIVAGYLSGVIRDATKGRTPKPLTTPEGGINTTTLTDAAARGGGLGILGDMLFHDYDRGYKSALTALAGPIASQVDPAASTMTMMKRGEWDKALGESGKLARDNTPFINLFYIRPILDYLVFWNLQEMTDPGSLRRTEETVMEKNRQGYFLRPSEAVK